MAPAANYVQPMPTVIQAAPIINLAQAIPIRSMGATTILPPPNKLPLPRNYTPSCSTGLVNIYNTPVVASQPWRLPKVRV